MSDVSHSRGGFAALGLHAAIVDAVNQAGYTTPTPIQEQAIPMLLEDRDLLASAHTGTGKTAAFMLPALQRLTLPAIAHGKGPRILVLVPTRELATQVSDAAGKYGRYLKRAKVVTIVGGMPYPAQNRLLGAPHEILVATPGRLIDHLDRGRIPLNRLEMLVLDEADRMLDMGFMEDVERIIEALPPARQTALFSATVDERIARLANQLLKEPEHIRLKGPQVQTARIEQKLFMVDDLNHKRKLLHHWAAAEEVRQMVVFVATKRDTETISDDLLAEGIDAAPMHGDMAQPARNRTLKALKEGRIRVLVATDVAARGIDVSGITHVLNFDLPRQEEDYVHRIGRTGRAGNSGLALSLVTRAEIGRIRRIERYTGTQIEVSTVLGMEPRQAALAPSGRPPRGQGGGRRPGQGQGGGRSGARDFAPRTEFADRPPRESRGFGGNTDSRPPREERSFGNRDSRPPREGRGFGSNTDSRPPREERSFGNRDSRPPREGRGLGSNTDSRAPREERSFGNRDSREGRERNGNTWESAPSSAGHPRGGDTRRREGGFGAGRPPRKSSFR